MTLSHTPILIWSRECLKSSSKGGDTFTSISIRVSNYSNNGNDSHALEVVVAFIVSLPCFFRQSIGIEHTKNLGDKVDNDGDEDDVVILVTSLSLPIQSILVTAVLRWKVTRLGSSSRSLTRAFQTAE
jgi:hypothetical protein